MNKYYTKISTLYIVLALAFSFGLSLVLKPSFVWVINLLTLSGGVALVVGIFRHLWMKGDFDLFGYRQTKSGYLEYKRQLSSEREEMTNPLLGAGVVLTALAILFTLIY